MICGLPWSWEQWDFGHLMRVQGAIGRHPTFVTPEGSPIEGDMAIAGKSHVNGGETSWENHP